MEQYKRRKHAHGGHDALDESRLRMKTKILQRQINKLGNKPKDDGQNEDRRRTLIELGVHFHERGMTKVACENYLSARRVAPKDEDLCIRVPLLCLLMDEARAEEASELVMGPLYHMPTLRKLAAPEQKQEKEEESDSEAEIDHE